MLFTLACYKVIRKETASLVNKVSENCMRGKVQDLFNQTFFQVKFVLMRVLSKETGRSKRAILPEENVIAKERRLITLCNEILEVLNVLDPGLSPNRGRVLKELISPFMSVSNYELKSETIDEKEFKMRKTFCSKLAKDLVECYKFEFI